MRRRRATNGILKASGSKAKPAAVMRLQEPKVFDTFKAIDRAKYKLGTLLGFNK